jgi:hypothetical protein
LQSFSFEVKIIFLNIKYCNEGLNVNVNPRKESINIERNV